LDGFEISSRLRANPSTAKLPILMFSAKAQEVDKKTGLQVGADEYLAKPAAPAEIINRVKKLLAHKENSSPQERVSG
jgi:DNA-binding response OmpR family regulator